jgi:hypothetical protein
MSSLAVKEVEFNSDRLYAAQDKTTEKVYVAVRWVCDGIGLNAHQKDRQVANIQTDLVLKQGSLKFEGGVFDPHHETWGIELDFLPLWLAKISITPKMKEDSPFVVQKLIEYQLKAKDVLAQAFIKNKQPNFNYEYFNRIVESGIIDIMQNQNNVICEQNNKLSVLENKYQELETRLSSSLGYRQIKVSSDRVVIKNLVNNLTKQYHLKYGEVWKRLDNEIKNRFNVDIQSRLKIALHEIQKQHILDKGKPYAELTLKQKYNRMDIIEEEGLLQEAENIILDMF